MHFFVLNIIFFTHLRIMILPKIREIILGDSCMLKIALIHVKLWNTPLVPLFVQLALWCSDWCFLISLYLPSKSFHFLLLKLFLQPLEHNSFMVKWFFFFPEGRRSSMYGTKVMGLICEKIPWRFCFSSFITLPGPKAESAFTPSGWLTTELPRRLNKIT